MGIKGLPLEICEQIIDYLWDDARALRACSKASRILVPAARHHLFHSVEIGSPADIHSLGEVLNDSNALGTGISHYVRELHIRTRSVAFCTSAAWAHPHLPRMMTMLGNVTELRLTKFYWHQGFSGAGLKSLPMVDALYLKLVSFDEIDDMLDLLSTYKHLTILHLSYVHIEGSTSHMTFPRHKWSFVSCIKEAIFTYLPISCSVALMKCMESCHQLSLCKLTWSGIRTPEVWAGLKSLLQGQQLSNSLEFLSIEIGWAGQSHDPLDFAGLNRLQVLRLTSRESPAQLSWLPGALSTIPSPHMKEISFIDAHLTAGDPRFRWRDIDNILAHRNWPNLILIFHVRASKNGRHTPSAWLEIFVHRLPNLASKGTHLGVEYWDIFSGQRLQLWSSG